MTNNKSNTKIIFVVLVLVYIFLFGSSSYVLAEYKLPEIMHGNTTLSVNGQTVYGGTTGNEVILNYDPSIITTAGGANDLLGFEKTQLELCNPVLPISLCYGLNTSSTSMKLMTSRTKVNGTDVLEISTLLYPTTTVIGDVYGVDNFALYGRNLSKNSSATNETWKVTGYTFNPEAQASYSADQKSYFDNHIASLNGEATLDTGISTGRWYLQSEGSNLNIPGDAGSTYPEGRVWKYNGNLTLGGDITIHGKGTLIVNGDLVLNKGVSIAKNTDADSLGLIVKENLKLFGNNSLDAAAFVGGIIDMSSQGGGNISATGSFVASDFKILNNYNIRFYYDFRLENNWPPGFRYFKMPSAQNSAP